MWIVTGGAGFIGSAMLAKLNAEGISDILVVDDLGHGTKWKNLVGKSYSDYLHKDKFLELIQSDAIGAVEAVVHMGACSSTTETDAEFLMRNNFHYTCSLAKWALKKGARFIYASSGATYGAGEAGYSDADENLIKLRPLNMYGYSKHLTDLWMVRNGLSNKVVGLKFFNVYGPNEQHKEEMRSVINKAYGWIKDKGLVTLYKSYRSDYKHGEQVRDFVYIKDAINVMWWLANKPDVNGIFNIGTSKARSWNDVARALFAALGIPPKIEYIEMPEQLRSQYQYFTEAPMAKLAAVGCPTNFYSLEDGISDYVRNYLVPDCSL